jgi:hypothetical protein
MNYQDILRSSYRLTIANPKLWLLGLFLSSGFNLHFWYAVDYLQRSSFINVITETTSRLHGFSLITVIVVVSFAALLFFNFVKVLFYLFAHDLIHDEKLELCVICKSKNNQNPAVLNWQKTLYQVVLASVITVVLSVSCAALFKLVMSHNYISDSGIMICFVGLLIIIGLISLWNCFFVLFTLWFGTNFQKSTVLSIDLLFSRLKQISFVMVLATLIFLGSVSIGGVLIVQVQSFLVQNLPVVFKDFQTPWTSLVSLASGIIFFAWLILNNVWFNMVITILFDRLVKAKPVAGPNLVKQYSVH